MQQNIGFRFLRYFKYAHFFILRISYLLKVGEEHNHQWTGLILVLCSQIAPVVPGTIWYESVYPTVLSLWLYSYCCPCVGGGSGTHRLLYQFTGMHISCFQWNPDFKLTEHVFFPCRAFLVPVLCYLNM